MNLFQWNLIRNAKVIIQENVLRMSSAKCQTFRSGPFVRTTFLWMLCNTFPLSHSSRVRPYLQLYYDTYAWLQCNVTFHFEVTKDFFFKFHLSKLFLIFLIQYKVVASEGWDLPCVFLLILTQGAVLYSLSGNKTSYCMIVWCLEAVSWGIIMIQSFWNWANDSAALLLRCLVNLRAISHSFETLQDLEVRRLMTLWIEALNTALLDFSIINDDLYLITWHREILPERDSACWGNVR